MSGRWILYFIMMKVWVLAPMPVRKGRKINRKERKEHKKEINDDWEDLFLKDLFYCIDPLILLLIKSQSAYFMVNRSGATRKAHGYKADEGFRCSGSMFHTVQTETQVQRSRHGFFESCHRFTMKYPGQICERAFGAKLPWIFKSGLFFAVFAVFAVNCFY